MHISKFCFWYQKDFNLFQVSFLSCILKVGYLFQIFWDRLELVIVKREKSLRLFLFFNIYNSFLSNGLIAQSRAQRALRGLNANNDF